MEQTSKQTCLVRKEWRSELNFFMHLYTLICHPTLSLLLLPHLILAVLWILPTLLILQLFFECLCPLLALCVLSFHQFPLSYHQPAASLSCDSLISCHFGV